MGCFLGCFGFSSKRKRRKPANKVLPGDPKHGSYEPLDSSVSTRFDITENPASSDCHQLSNRIKIGKKVSFNLNIQTYEPLSKDETRYHLSDSDGEEEKEKNGAETEKVDFFTVSEGNSTTLKTGSFPPNYRYQNLTDSYEDEDEDDFEYSESDLDINGDDEEEEDEDENEDECDEYENEDVGGIAIDIDDQRVTKSEFLKQLSSQPQQISWIHSAEDKSNNHMQLPGLIDGKLRSIESKRNGRDRSQFVNSVLNPVENLTQWKAVKARAAPPKPLRKENNALQQEPQTPFDLETGSNLYPSSLGQNHSQLEPLLQEVAVNASLSNWLALLNPKESKASSISVENVPPKSSISDKSCLQEGREDTPSLEITDFKA